VIADARTRKVHSDVRAEQCVPVDRAAVRVPPELGVGAGLAADEPPDAMALVDQMTA
jgi:hypothetical protein